MRFKGALGRRGGSLPGRYSLRMLASSAHSRDKAMACPTLRFPCGKPSLADCFKAALWRRRMGIEPTHLGISPGAPVLKTGPGTSRGAPPKRV